MPVLISVYHILDMSSLLFILKRIHIFGILVIIYYLKHTISYKTFQLQMEYF